MELQVIFWAIIISLAVSIIAYLVMAALKGKLKIKMEKVSFTSGDTIHGEIELLAKKEIEGNFLSVSLECDEKISYRENDKTRTESSDVYEKEIRLEGGNNYPAGYSGTYHFEFEAPTAQQLG